MKTQAGVWLDHQDATIVFLRDLGDEVRHINIRQLQQQADRERNAQHNPGGHENSASHPSEQCEHKFGEALSRFYDEIVFNLAAAQQILIMGPGEAKLGLRRCMEHKGLNHQILEVRSTERLSEAQVIAETRRIFQLQHQSR